MTTKLFAVRDTRSLSVIGLVTEDLKQALSFLGDHVLIDEVESMVSNGNFTENQESFSYLGFQPIGTHKMNDQYKLITRTW
jgi:hypothetical protein